MDEPFSFPIEDAARKALEDALSGKKDLVNKWDAEIKKQINPYYAPSSLTSPFPPPPRPIRTPLSAFHTGPSHRGLQNQLHSLPSTSPPSARSFHPPQYLLFTQGLRIVAFLVNCILFVLRGFKGPRSQQQEIYTPRAATAGAAGGDGDVGDAGKREESVRQKWGGDE
ncbi:unnamed protein product [Closterium sp. Naga37s-1]|nr:unnamed protein product [Closterium sp. Naga37s-1]